MINLLSFVDEMEKIAVDVNKLTPEQRAEIQRRASAKAGSFGYQASMAPQGDAWGDRAYHAEQRSDAVARRAGGMGAAPQAAPASEGTRPARAMKKTPTPVAAPAVSPTAQTVVQQAPAAATPTPHSIPHSVPHPIPSAAAAEQAVSHAPGIFSRMAAGARKVAPAVARVAAHSPLAFAAGSGLAGIGGTAGVSAFRHRRRDQAQQG
jgi:hypothetical protein